MLSGTNVGGRFEIIELMRSGGMGSIYAARDGLTGQRVALKVLEDAGPIAGARFLREGALLSQIVHPGIVRHVAHGITEANAHYLAMEWLEGEDLGERLAREPLGIHETVSLVASIARSLDALHARQIVHRDVKPSNLFLVDCSPHTPKLLDFGIARQTLPSARVTRTGVTVGTLGYMAPEQVRGERDLDTRCDVFALGCVMFECLTGRPPFVGEHAASVLARMLFEPAPAPSELYGDLPPELDALVLAMLARDRDARPSDGGAVARALDTLPDMPRQPPSSTVGSTRSARAITESEQRMVSVVLGEPLTPASTLAPEDTAELEAAIAEIAAIPGARVETVANQSIVVAFAGEGAATDCALKVARAALRMRELLQGFTLSIATGKVVVAAGGKATFSVGDAVDRAARALSPSPRIAIDLTTAQLIDRRFAISGRGEDLELLSEESVANETRTVLGKRTPCVGRERELAVLSATFEECASESVARSVLVTGPPGIGKSRIRHELIRRLERRDDPVRIWLARADPVGRGSPFAALSRAIRGAVGILDGEPLAHAQRKIGTAVARSATPENAQRLTELLAELVGAPFAEADAPRMRAARRDPMLLGDEMRRAFEDFVAAECRHGPLLIVLEDLHWGDVASVLWIDGALRNLHDKPLMVLATARPEVHELFPKLWHGRGMTELHVAELSRKASESLAREVLGPAADPQAIARVVERAAGNAFYLEELLRAASHEERAELPDTVLAMVHARLSALDAEARRVLRAGSVFGQVFWRSGLEALLGTSAQQAGTWLDALVADEFIERRAHARFPGEEEYAFRHALTREATYSMLTAEDRRVGHRLAGNWLEASGERDPMVLAEHFELGGRPALAMRHVRRAAEHALEGNDFQGVPTRVERGKRIGAEGPNLGELLTLEAEAHMWRNEYVDAERTAGEAMKLLPRGSAAWCSAGAQLAFAMARLARREPAKALAAELRAAERADDAADAFAVAISRIAAWMFQAGEVALAEDLLTELSRAAEAHRDLRTAGALHMVRATALLLARDGSDGSLEASFQQMLLAAACFADAGDLRRASVARSNAGCAATELGQFDVAEEYLSRALADAERMSLSVTLSVRENLGKLLARKGRAEEAKQILGSAIAMAAERKYPRADGACRGYLAGLYAKLGDLENAEAEARNAVRVLETIPPVQAQALGILSRVLLAQGRVDGALSVAIRANEIRESAGALEEGDALVRLAHAEALRARGETAAALEAIGAAARRLRERAAKIENPEYRRSFLENVEENRLTLELEKVWREQA